MAAQTTDDDALAAQLIRIFPDKPAEQIAQALAAARDAPDRINAATDHLLQSFPGHTDPPPPAAKRPRIDHCDTNNAGTHTSHEHHDPVMEALAALQHQFPDLPPDAIYNRLADAHDLQEAAHSIRRELNAPELPPFPASHPREGSRDSTAATQKEEDLEGLKAFLTDADRTALEEMLNACPEVSARWAWENVIEKGLDATIAAIFNETPDGAANTFFKNTLAMLALAAEVRPRENLKEEKEDAAETMKPITSKGESKAGETKAGKTKARETKAGEKTSGGWPKGTGYSEEDIDGTRESGAASASHARIRAEEEGQVVGIVGRLEQQLRSLGSEEESAETFGVAEKSALVPYLEAELKELSLLDMGAHVKKYKAIFRLLAALSVQPALLPLLAPLKKQRVCVMQLLHDRAVSSRHFTATLAKAVKKTSGDVGRDDEDEAEQQLAEQVTEVFEVLEKAMSEAGIEWKVVETGENERVEESLEERYKTEMGRMQFDNFDAAGHKLVGVRAPGVASIRRILKEVATLRESLPLQIASSIAIRVDESRLHLIRAVIFGPEGTPYAHGAFFFDIAIPDNYPNLPPRVHFLTTGAGQARFNPNLYEDGTVCLSLLGTWEGEPWNPATSTLLQVLVSIQSLILVHQPFFNEPGEQDAIGTPEGDQQSSAYNIAIRRLTIQWAVLDALRSPPPAFQHLIRTHFRLKNQRLLRDFQRWLQQDPALLPNQAKIQHALDSL